MLKGRHNGPSKELNITISRGVEIDMALCAIKGRHNGPSKELNITISRGVEIDMALCAKREAHWTFKGTKYYYSGFTNDLDDEVIF